MSKNRTQILFDADIRRDKITFAKYVVRAGVFRPSEVYKKSLAINGNAECKAECILTDTHAGGEEGPLSTAGTIDGEF